MMTAHTGFLIFGAKARRADAAVGSGNDIPGSPGDGAGS
jgi:hypothetical protein